MKKLDNLTESQANWLFWGCFAALMATSVGFMVRAQTIGAMGAEFGLSETQKGEIFGVGLWPFSISIILFSLLIDKIGYGISMIIAFVLHVTSAIVTIFADGYWMLYWGTFILALGNGTVEAVINPAVATIYPREKTKWMNILHAGWPAGLVLGGVLSIIMGPEVSWKWKVGLVLIPVIFYGVILYGKEFPVQERVKAGISFKDMIGEAGAVGFFLIFLIILLEINRVAGLTPMYEGSFLSLPHISLTILLLLVTVGCYVYTESLGRPLFIILLLIMIPLATTELGVDSWVTDLLAPILGDNAGWVVVYTAVIMTVLRFYAGPIVHRISPLGLLALSSAIALVGLYVLSTAAGFMIFIAATLYAVGKTFFWPTMLGIAGERFPRGGALTLNGITGVGMLAAGVFGAAFLGNIQDKQIDSELKSQNPSIHSRIMGEEKSSVWGNYKPIDQNKLESLSSTQKSTVGSVQASAKQGALSTVAVFPAVMLLAYIAMMMYFRSIGGYKPILLEDESDDISGSSEKIEPALEDQNLKNDDNSKSEMANEEE